MGAESLIPVPDYAGRVVVVLGLDERGLAAARALVAGGARVLAWDDRLEPRLRAEAEGFETADLNTRDWGDVAALVVGSSAALSSRFRELAALTRTPILSDLELFTRGLAAKPASVRGRIVAVTGARGKSTTAALIGHVLKGCGRDAQVGGHAGLAPLALAEPHAGAIYILELDARDVERAPSLAPKIAVFLNAEEDPERRPGDAAAQAKMFARQTSTDYAVVGVDDPFGRALATDVGAREGGPSVAAVSVSRTLGRGVHAVGGVLFDALDGRANEALDLRRARALIGRGGWQDAAAAYAVCRLLGLESNKIAEQIARFPGLAHRLEEVGVQASVQGGVRFFNDSMAADAGAARQGLAAFENIYWIAGGGLKGAGFAGLTAFMPRVAKAYFIGEAAGTAAAQLKGRVVAEVCRDLAQAVEHAAADASRSKRADPVVLLSPGCAAGEQFADEAARGDAFRALVRTLPEASPSVSAA